MLNCLHFVSKFILRKFIYYITAPCLCLSPGYKYGSYGILQLNISILWQLRNTSIWDRSTTCDSNSLDLRIMLYETTNYRKLNISWRERSTLLVDSLQNWSDSKSGMQIPWIPESQCDVVKRYLCWYNFNIPALGCNLASCSYSLDHSTIKRQLGQSR